MNLPSRVPPPTSFALFFTPRMWSPIMSGVSALAQKKMVLRLQNVAQPCQVLQCMAHLQNVLSTFFPPQVVSHNVRRFRFALPDKKMVIGLPIGSHITIAAKDTEGKDVMRPYTPVTDDNSKGYVDFVIKAGFFAPPLL